MGRMLRKRRYEENSEDGKEEYWEEYIEKEEIRRR